MASDKLAKLIRFVFGLIAKGKPIDDDAIKDIQKIVGPELKATAKDTPAPSTTLPASAPPSLLDLYSRIFAIVCAAMAEANTSVALRGFAHDRQCISYWRLSGGKPHFTLQSDYLFPTGLDVYLIKGFDNSTEDLAALNKAIRHHEMPDTFTDIKGHESVVKLRRVHDFRIEVTGLLPELQRQMAKNAPDPFHIHNYDEPQDYSIRFADEASPLPAMLESLTEAIEAQESYRIALDNAVAPPK